MDARWIERLKDREERERETVLSADMNVTALFCQVATMLFGAFGTEHRSGECSGVTGGGEM